MLVENKTVVGHYFKHWGEPEAEKEMLSPDFIAHMPGIPEPLNREAFIEYQGVVRAAFPDFAPTLEEQIAEGDKVVNRLTFRGTHQGDFQGIPPTGKRVKVTATTIERVVDGKIAEHWIDFDALGMMQQLGEPARSGRGFLSPTGEGQSYEVMGIAWTFKALGEQTGGAVEAIELVFPPGTQLPPHVHQTFDEAIHVAAGQLTVQAGDRAGTLGAGSLAFVPRGTVHRIENAGASPARILLWETPAPGMNKLMEELDALQLPPGPPDMQKIVPVLLQYDIEMVDGS